MFDGQVGGKIYSRSHALYATGGAIVNDDDPNLPLTTTEGRTVYSVSYDVGGDPIYTLVDAGGVVGPGWKYDDSGNLVENDVVVPAGGAGYVGYFYNYYGNGFNRDNIEAATYDASYLKLRELSISYDLTMPCQILGGLVQLHFHLSVETYYYSQMYRRLILKLTRFETGFS